jgi:hypothetical protein
MPNDSADAEITRDDNDLCLMVSLTAPRARWASGMCSVLDR